MLRKMLIVLGIYKFGCSLECRDQKVSSKAQTSGFEIALLHEKFSPGLIFLHANMHNTQKFPREKTFPKIRLNLSMPLLLCTGAPEYLSKNSSKIHQKIHQKIVFKKFVKKYSFKCIC